MSHQTLEQFEAKIWHEFCDGSGINPGLYEAAVSVHSDIEFASVGGEPYTPIHDALGWHYARFREQANETFYGAIFRNEDGTVWQVKLDKPRPGKKRPYEVPVGNGSRTFQPPINRKTRRAIARRHGCKVPSDGSFWQWLEEHPEIPIIWTEGGKKALSWLGEGYVTIALYGVNSGYTRDRMLTPDVQRFCQSGRRHILAFDQDSKQSTRRKVSTAQWRFSRLLEQSGGEVAIALWDGAIGKGADDLKVAAGVAAVERAIVNAMPFAHWQHWQRLEGRLTYSATARVNTSDLSQSELTLPDSGIIGIASAKGTGKTKLIGQAVGMSETVIAPGHRIALMRNLSQRLGLDYISDLDKADGQFINGAAYSFRVGLCVDSLLAIDPTKFAGCDLVIDEVCQVVRHLLTSDTCGRDGKRPALLGRFAELVRAARRVILADADLGNATIAYVQKLRDDGQPVHLLINDYQSGGYPVQFIDSPDQSEAIAQVLADVEALPPGKVLYVATDSKDVTKRLKLLIPSNKRVLVINSETSGGEAEREFIQFPDRVLARGEYDVVIASPSLGTGVSSEIQGIFERVYGLFGGHSITDGDMSQALGRVREPVERVVWCSKTGRAYSKISRDTNPAALKAALQSRTSATISLIRSNLRADIAGQMGAIAWDTDPNIKLFCEIEAARNRSMLDLRTALLVRLRHEGNQVQLVKRERNQAIAIQIAQASKLVKVTDAQSLLDAANLTALEVEAMSQRDDLTPGDHAAIAKHWLCDFYAIAPDDLDIDFVLADHDGQRRAALRGLEELLYPGVAADRAVKQLERQSDWNQGLVAWDITGAEIRRNLRIGIGLEQFLDPEKTWTAKDLATVAAKAREWAAAIKAGLNLTIRADMSDVQIVHQLLAQMGVKVAWAWKGNSRSGDRHRVYRLDGDVWSANLDILERRRKRREDRALETGSPPPFNIQNRGGDPKLRPSPIPPEWRSPAVLADVRSMLGAAQTPDERAELEKFIPIQVLELADRAIAS